MNNKNIYTAVTKKKKKNCQRKKFRFNHGDSGNTFIRRIYDWISER